MRGGVRRARTVLRGAYVRSRRDLPLLREINYKTWRKHDDEWPRKGCVPDPE